MIFELIESFLNFMLCLPFTFKQTALCFANIFSPLKHYIQTISAEEVFSISMLYLIAYKSVKIFDIDIMWLIIICYQQQIHAIFEFFNQYMDWISQIIFITKHINADTILLFNFIIILFRDRKFKITIIKATNHLSLCFCYSFRMCF